MKKAYLIVLLLSSFVFSQDNYNRTWATYFGGSDFFIQDAVSDRFGNLVVTAYTTTNSTTAIMANDVAYYNQFKTTSGLPYQAGLGEGQSIIAKFSQEGNLLFASYLPYSISSIELGEQDKYYIKGFTTQTNLGTAGTWMPTPTIVLGGSYMIITQLNDDFTTNWLSYFPNDLFETSYETPYIDNYNNIYINGLTKSSSTNNITTGNTFQPSFITEYDSNNDIIPNGYLCKLNNAGQMQWGTFLGMMGVGNIVNLNGELLLQGSRFESLPAYDGYYCTETDCNLNATNLIVTKIDPNNGQRLFGSYFPNNASVFGDMVTDGTNFYFITMMATNEAIPLNAYQNANGGGYDLYLSKYNSNFQLQWATYIGGSGFEYLSDIRSWLEYKDGYLYLSAYTDSSNNFIFSPNSYSATKQGSDDNFIIKFSTSGALVWGSYYGGLGKEHIYSKIVSTSNEAFYICGSTTSTSGMTTTGCHQETMNIHPVLNVPFGDKWNGYIAKFSPVVLSSDSFTENTIQIYPNPSNGMVTISGGNLSKEKHQLTIYNELGQQVYNKNMALFNEYTINLSHLSKGVYFIILLSEESNLKQTEKLIIK